MTAVATQEILDQEKASRFQQKMLDVINDAAVGLMTSIGHRTGLFDTLAAMEEPGTPGQIAEAAGLSERYVREWLGAMVTGGVIDYVPADKTYRLPPEHASILTRSASPNNFAVTMQWVAVLGSVENQVVEAFKHGRGVPYSEYHDFHRVMAEESGQTVVSALFDHILPLVPGLTSHLQGGIEVLDIACGAGRAMIELACAFPQSRFTGYDLSSEAIDLARAEARRRGAQNVRFEVRDVAGLSESGAFDLITAFDAIHDQAKPQQVLDNIRRALKPKSGLLLMQDIRACTHLRDNIDNPLSPIIYTVSCMHCMSVSLANGGPGLGAAWGREMALEMLSKAGFGEIRVETLDHDPLNYYYLARPKA